MGERWYASDVLLDQLSKLGCDHLAINPGATLRGLHDSLVNPAGRAPEMIVCLHEEIAVALAHGYGKMAGRPMAVGLHDTVGLLHASMALFNAWVDRAGLLALVGTGPLDADQRRPWIDWVHTVADQTELVRHHAVLTDQPHSPAAAVAGIARAWERIQTTPAGPAVVGLDVLLQERPVDGPAPDPRIPAAQRLPADPDVVAGLVEALAASKRPLFVVDRPLAPGARADLLELSDRLGAGLVDMGGGSNVPVGRVNDLTEGASLALGAADVIVCIEVRDPAWALGPVDLDSRRGGELNEGVRAFDVGMSELMDRAWMSTTAPFPAEARIVGDAGYTLAAVLDRVPPAHKELASAFRAAAAVRPPEPVDSQGRVHPGNVASTLRAALGTTDWTVAAGAMGGWARRGLSFDEPHHFLGRSGGEGLGYALGATLGAALAARGSDRLVIGLQGDGDLMYTPQALWTAAHHGLAALILIDDNSTYHRDELHQQAMARLRGRSVEAVGPGLHLTDPVIDHVGLAQSQGVTAFGPIASRAELVEVLPRAIDVVRSGEPAVVAVRTTAP